MPPRFRVCDDDGERDIRPGDIAVLAHPMGRHKALWLTGHGFAPEAWRILAEAIKLHATMHDVASAEKSLFGIRYVVEGTLVTPDGRNPLVRSVWFIETGDDAPQFVTVYPLRGGAA